MPSWIDGAHFLGTPKQRLFASGLVILLCRCAVYDSGLVVRSNEGGASSTGSGGSASPSGGAGTGSIAGTDSMGDGGSNVSSGGSAGASSAASGGAGGTTAGNNGTAGTIATTGAGGGAGACGASASSTDLALFRDGVFMTGWSTVGSWLTCNGTPVSATINATMALAVDLSCNTFNGALIVDWNSTVPACAYSSLSFDIYFANPADIATLQVLLHNAAGPTGLHINVATLIASPQSKAFNHVSLPLSSFGSDFAAFNGVDFFNASATGMPLFYVNNVVLGIGAPTDAGAD